MSKRMTVFLVAITVVFTVVYLFTYWEATSRLICMSGDTCRVKWSTEKEEKLLFIAIVTATIRVDRRQAIRETWMTKCTENKRCAYKFITDGQLISGKQSQGPEREALEKENRLYGDIIFAQSPPGVNFARRYLWMIKWVDDQYDMKYLLRLDDDYFICIERLMLELEFHRPKEKFSWGYLHCRGIGHVILDQAFLLISQDITKNLLQRVANGTLPCSPWISQAFATWMNQIPDLQTFGDNERLLQYVPKVRAEKMSEICQTSLGIHKSYPPLMRVHWSVFKKERSNNSYSVPPTKYNCRFPQQGYDSTKSYKLWRFEQKPCKDNPVWGDGSFLPGRELDDRGSLFKI